MTRKALHARCAVVVLSATICVRNYAGCAVKPGSCWKCSSGYHVICLRYSCNSTDTARRAGLGDSGASR